MSNKLLEVRNLTIGLAKNHHYLPAIDGVNFSIDHGETLAIVGETGSGKSLTCLAIMQLLPPAAQFIAGSEIYLSGQDLLTLPETAVRKIRGRRIAMIFQEPMTSLNPVMTIGEQLKEVLWRHFRLRGRAAKQRVLKLLHDVGLPDPAQQYDSYPHQLSGGMKQRTMIAMALAGEPDLLIADEPTSALDVTIQAQILQLLKELQAKLGMALLLVTHDLGVVQQVADRVAVMYAGHIVEEASKEAIFSAPKHPYTRKLFASLPNIAKRRQSLAVIPGSVPPITEKLPACRFANRCDFAWDICSTVAPRWLAVSPEQYVRCHLYDTEWVATRPEKITQPIVNHTSIPQNTVADSDGKQILTVEHLKIYFPIQKGLFRRTVSYVKAVDDVSLQLQAGKTLALVGESGCGKTTLARGLLHLIPSTAGMLSIGGLDVQHLHLGEMKNLRHFAQIIFQDPYSSMNPRMLVGDIIAEGMVALGLYKKAGEREARVLELLTLVGLPSNSLYRYPHEFSGGQRQRICIARALAVDPKLLICDEPTSALDVSVQAQILNLLRKLQREQGLSYLFITHNMAVVAYLADEIAVMYQGKIVEQGPAEDVLRAPRHEYTKKLLAAVPMVESPF